MRCTARSSSKSQNTLSREWGLWGRGLGREQHCGLASLKPSSTPQEALRSGLEHPQPLHGLLCTVHHSDALRDQVPAGFQP